MIEITCTQTDKTRIIQALHAGMGSIENGVCLFPRKAQFCIQDRDASCMNCLKTKIKWNIVQNRKAGVDHAT